MQTLKFSIGDRMTIEITGNTPLEIWPDAAFWASLPTVCPICGAGVVPEYTTPKTYKYFKLKCIGPQPHAVSLGQRQIDSGLYFDRSKSWEQFRPGMSEDDHAAEREAAAAPAHSNAPAGEKGQVINAILEQLNACHIRNISEANRVDKNKLGGQSIEELKRCNAYLAKLLSPPEDDIPF